MPLLLLLELSAQNELSGQAIYSEHCASCHGNNGEGVEGKCEEPLHGERSLTSLIKYIDRYMPEEEPHLVIGVDAQHVAEYIMANFYSPEARSLQAPPAKAFAHLTNRQLRESIADTIGSSICRSQPGDGTGLTAKYYQSNGMNQTAKLVMERRDTALSFHFGESSPCDGINAEQFSIVWDGSLFAPSTGWYEFKISTPNGARLQLNQAPEEKGGDSPDVFIDAWVSSGTEVRVHRKRIFLLGGRSYLLHMHYFKFKEKHGSIQLEWKRPHGVWEVVSAPYVSPSWAQHVAIIDTELPADDASEGYERGTDVSKAWHEATTAAAIQAANQVVALIHYLTPNRHDRSEGFREFLLQFAERAFRAPLDDETKALYVDSMFHDEMTPEESLKRAVILILQSPRFLYPEIRREKDDFTIASRLALGMWDSIPDEELHKAAHDGQLRNPEVLRYHAQRMLNDPRARAKIQDFFQQWLKLSDEDEMRKNQIMYPSFDASIVADLRESLVKFIDHIVWDENSDYRQLMLADYLFLNDRLTKFYELPAAPGLGFHPIKMEKSPRSGVITHPYLMAKFSHADSTSPIHRGVFLTRNILGGILKPPPEAISFENHQFPPNLSMREKITQLTKSSNCMSCHEAINPLGFSLEHFDAVGRYRIADADKPIQANAEYHSLEGETIHLRGAHDVAQHAIHSPSARRGFIRQMLQSITKQNASVYGSDTLHNLDQSFVESAYHMRKIFLKINLLHATHGTNNTSQ